MSNRLLCLLIVLVLCACFPFLSFASFAKGKSVNQGQRLTIKDAFAVWMKRRGEVYVFLFPEKLDEKCQQAILEEARHGQPLVLTSKVHPSFADIRQKAEARFLFYEKIQEPTLKKEASFFVILWNGREPAKFAYHGDALKKKFKKSPFIQENGRWFVRLSVKDEDKKAGAYYQFKIKTPLHLVR